MSRFGILCPTATGHLNPMMALGRELRRRGHEVFFYQIRDVEKLIAEGGFSFRAFGEKEYPRGILKRLHVQLGQLTGRKALAFTVQMVTQRTSICLRDLPALVRQDQIDALLVDQIAYEGETLAMHLDLPFITISNAVVLNYDRTVPPFFKTWKYDTSLWGQMRNQSAYLFVQQMANPILVKVNEYRRKFGLPLAVRGDEGISPLAQISQQIAEFDFPRKNLPETFHYAGPFHDAEVSGDVPFPYEQLDGRPLVYACMGTLQNQHDGIFRSFAEALLERGVQAVFSLGNGGDPKKFSNLPGDPIVVRYAPQFELLKRSSLCLTHAGLNTALEALANGVPMVAVPITNDQPGVAARIAWTGCGEFLELADLQSERLRRVIDRVLEQPSYAARAKLLQEKIKTRGGARTACDIIEKICMPLN